MHETSRVARRAGIALLGIGLAATLAACSGSPEPTSAASTPPVVAPSASVASPSPTIEVITSPLSGREGGLGTPIVIVKYDNTRAAQPHRGLTSADVVYVEPVEGGLTRIAAVFSTKLPTVVGPVRSARISDLDLAAQYGKVAFVFSGAQTKLLPKIAAADWLPFSNDYGSAGFQREYGTGRYAPTNLMADLKTIAKDAGDEVAVTSDIGWVFDEEAPLGGTAAKRMTADWLNSTVQMRWNAKEGAYDVWLNGSQAQDTAKPGVQRASTVVVQYVKQYDSGYGDKFGGITPMVETVGHGKGLVLRDGQSYPITWVRGSEQEPTQYLDAEGQQIAFDPGQVWVLLVDKNNKVRMGS